MDAELRVLTQAMSLAPGTTPDAIEAVQRQLGRELPSDYTSFMLEANGGEGPVGARGYCALYPIGSLVEETRKYAAFEQFHGLVVFGSDMGGQAYCFDSDGTVIEVAFVSAPEDNLRVGSFTEFMRGLGAGRF